MLALGLGATPSPVPSDESTSQTRSPLFLSLHRAASCSEREKAQNPPGLAAVWKTSQLCSPGAFPGQETRRGRGSPNAQRGVGARSWRLLRRVPRITVQRRRQPRPLLTAPLGAANLESRPGLSSVMATSHGWLLHCKRTVHGIRCSALRLTGHVPSSR